MIPYLIHTILSRISYIYKWNFREGWSETHWNDIAFLNSAAGCSCLGLLGVRAIPDDFCLERGYMLNKSRGSSRCLISWPLFGIKDAKSWMCCLHILTASDARAHEWLIFWSASLLKLPHERRRRERRKFGKYLLKISKSLSTNPYFFLEISKTSSTNPYVCFLKISKSWSNNPYVFSLLEDSKSVSALSPPYWVAILQ